MNKASSPISRTFSASFVGADEAGFKSDSLPCNSPGLRCRNLRRLPALPHAYSLHHPSPLSASTSIPSNLSSSSSSSVAYSMPQPRRRPALPPMRRNASPTRQRTQHELGSTRSEPWLLERSCGAWVRQALKEAYSSIAAGKHSTKLPATSHPKRFGLQDFVRKTCVSRVAGVPEPKTCLDTSNNQANRIFKEVRSLSLRHRVATSLSLPSSVSVLNNSSIRKYRKYARSFAQGFCVNRNIHSNTVHRCQLLARVVLHITRILPARRILLPGGFQNAGASSPEF